MGTEGLGRGATDHERLRTTGLAVDSHSYVQQTPISNSVITK